MGGCDDKTWTKFVCVCVCVCACVCLCVTGWDVVTVHFFKRLL